MIAHLLVNRYHDFIKVFDDVFFERFFGEDDVKIIPEVFIVIVFCFSEDMCFLQLFV